MKLADQILEKIENGSAVIGVVGLGYVGLPLILGFVGRGFRVMGIDIDRKKIEAIRAGESYIEHIPGGSIAEAVESGKLEVTTDFSEASRPDALIMCVPTPLDEHFEPDLSFVLSTMESLVPHLRPGQVVSLESTTYPGTTDEELRPLIEDRGLAVGTDIFLVYSPEREDPGNPDFSATSIPKVVGGTTGDCARVGQALYQAVVSEVVPVRSTQVAEFTKLLENIYRAVNIGLINEITIMCDKLGVDVWEVIAAAKTKPFGYMPFYPGPGLGGHCIPIDPLYLSWKLKSLNFNARFIELADEINMNMPRYVVSKVTEALNEDRKPVRGSQILVLGVAYKPDVDDVRESPAIDIIQLLQQQGAAVSFHDPHVADLRFDDIEMRSVEYGVATVASADCVLIVTDHSAYDWAEILDNAQLVVDTRNATADLLGRARVVTL